MINLTLSTNGLSRAGNECHEVAGIDHTKRVYGTRVSPPSIEIVSLTLTRAQAIALVDDLRAQIDYSDRAQDVVARAMFG